MMNCPECKSSRVIKNGTMETWRKRIPKRVQMYRCNSCGRRFQGKR